MSKPTCTNSPTSSSVCGSMDVLQSIMRLELKLNIEDKPRKYARSTSDRLEVIVNRSRYLFSETYCGGYSGEDPPLPIPNREVKLTSADGTAPPGGRVGSCHFYIQSPRHLTMSGIFCFYRSAKLIPPLAPSHFVGPTPYAGVRNANSGNQLRLTSLSTISELICM